MTIRDFTPEDYQHLADIQSALYDDMPAVAEDYIETDANRDAKCKYRRWLLEQDGQVIAHCEYSQSVWDYHPQHFRVLVRVLPDYQGRGIGGRLYDHVIDALQPFDPLVIKTMAREDHPHALRFVEQRGFVVHVRDQRSALVPAEFDPAPFAEFDQRLAAEGIVIKSLNQLADDPDRNRKAYELEMAVVPDIPGTEDFTEPGLEHWVKEVLDAPMLLKDLYLIAVTPDGDYAGMTCLWADRASDMLYTGLTGVKREYRRKGIATALKVHAISWAKAHNRPRINTDNADTNPMLQLNYRLGFRPLPGWVSYKKTVRDGA